MRRPDKTGGVIRPRTLGLGRAAAPEPPPPPPPPPPPSILQNKRVVYGALLALFLLAVFYTMGGSKSGGSSGPAEVAADGENDAVNGGSLRTGGTPIEADDDEDGEEAGEDSKAEKRSNKVSSDDDEEESAGTDEEGDASQEAEDKTTDDDGEGEFKEDAAPARTQQVGSANSNQDRSKTVESYFINFGGRVVDIDKEGSYKYVLVKMEDMFGNKALVVRGCPHHEGTHCKHGDAFARAKAELELRGFKATVLGGGRITRHPSRRQKGQKAGYISVFGYSKTFGACEECNKITCSLIKALLPDHGIKWANEGYLESDERKIRDEAWTRC